MVLQWAIGLLATAGLAFNSFNANTNAGQEVRISDNNREIGEVKTDIKYIRESLEELKMLQIKSLQAQGITYLLATSTNQSIKP